MDFGSEREESEDGRVALSLRRGPPLCNRDHGKDQRAQASGRAMEWNGIESNPVARCRCYDISARVCCYQQCGRAALLLGGVAAHHLSAAFLSLSYHVRPCF